MPSLLLACLAFFGISLPDGLLGIAWPSMRVDLRVPIAALSLLLPLEVASFMLSSASTGMLLARIGLGRLLAASIALSGLALFGLDLALPIGVFTGLAMFVPYIGFGVGLVEDLDDGGVLDPRAAITDDDAGALERGRAGGRLRAKHGDPPVSYTHLTLPTILLV